MTEPDPLTTALHRWMRAFMHRSMQNFFPYLKSQGISMSQFGAMMHLERCDQCGVSEIAEHLGITSAAASQLLDKLVQLGCIDRAEAAHDRRLKSIMLTPAGRQLLADALHEREKWVEALAAALTPAERQQVSAALDILVEKTKHLEEPLQ